MCKPSDSHSHARLTVSPIDLARELIPRRVRRIRSGRNTTPLSEQQFRVVVHDYHDHLMDTEGSDADEAPVARTKGGVTVTFPVKLHEILKETEDNGHADVISWQPHGRCFAVHQQQKFVSEVMPLYFKQRKFASFQRQLNLYGFQRLTRGTDGGAYYHELFLKNRPCLAQKIVRQRVKGTGVRPRSNPETEPNFYEMPSIFDTIEEPSPPLPIETTSSSTATNAEPRPTPRVSMSTATNVDPKQTPRVSMSMSVTEAALYNETTAVEATSNLKSPCYKRMASAESWWNRSRSPSPAVADHRSPREKLESSFSERNIIPYIETSCSKSELEQRPESDDDEVIIFEGKPFHLLGPDSMGTRKRARPATPEENDTKRRKQGRNLATMQMQELVATLNRATGLQSANLDDMDESTFGSVLECLVGM